MKLQRWQAKALFLSGASIAAILVAATVVLSFKLLGRPFPGFFLHANLTVGPVSVPEWSGRHHGLRFLDRIVEFQGEPVPSAKAIYDAVGQAPPGTPFTYTVERGGDKFTLSVPSMKFSFRDWALSFGIYLLVGVGFVAIGFAPYYVGAPSPSAAVLFFMTGAIFVWFVTTFDFMATHALPPALRAGAMTLTPSLGIHLALLLTGRKAKRRLLFAIYGAAVVLAAFYVVTFRAAGPLWPRAAQLAYLYGCFAAVAFLALLWRALRRPLTSLERSRLRVILGGAVLGFFLPTLGTVLVTSFGWDIPYNFLLIPAVFFPLSVAYALVQYNLFEIDFLIKVSLTRGALTGALLLIYVVIASLLSLSVGVYEADPVAPVLFSILVAVVFNPMLRSTEALVTRYLDRKEYDPDRLESEVSGLLRSLGRPQVLAQKFLEKISSAMAVEAAFVFFPSSEGGCQALARRFEVTAPEEFPAVFHAQWRAHFRSHRKGISRDEAAADPSYEDERDILLGVFERLAAELLIPLFFEEELIGLVSLGKKRSGKAYTADDFELVRRLGDQLALALENGLLFEESEKAKERYRALYDEAGALNRRLIEMDRLKKHFIANVSHELRTPISTIIGYAEILQNVGVTKDSRWVLERLVNNGQELAHLMDSLLDFSRMEAGTLETSSQALDLEDLTASLETAARRLLRDRPVRFRRSVEPGARWVETDAKKLQQILMHLLTNAVKFTEQGEIAIEVRTAGDGAQGAIEIAVLDTGIGISPQDQAIIFEDFRQLDGSSTRRYGGTGVGLALCRKLAGALGGRIQVQSARGAGSTFTVVLPRRPIERATEPSLEGAAPAA
ncbi:MAG TPA: ATP-binding protein [Candidatus Acidoferrales bacterium]|nr:ATP-binding protein [Candidatus Acidoferrales bacterium]